jgi:hypothetical protein
MLMARSFADCKTGNYKMIAGNMNSSLRAQDINFMRSYAEYLDVMIAGCERNLPTLQALIKLPALAEGWRGRLVALSA